MEGLTTLEIIVIVYFFINFIITYRLNIFDELNVFECFISILFALPIGILVIYQKITE